MKTDNQIIAEFMGIQVYQTSEEMRAVPIEDLREWTYEDQIDYHKNWSNLMPVVEKIESMKCYVSINGKSCAIYNYFDVQDVLRNKTPEDVRFRRASDSKIDATYQAVIAYIKWHNSTLK